MCTATGHSEPMRRSFTTTSLSLYLLHARPHLSVRSLVARLFREQMRRRVEGVVARTNKKGPTPGYDDQIQGSRSSGERDEMGRRPKTRAQRVCQVARLGAPSLKRNGMMQRREWSSGPKLGKERASVRSGPGRQQQMACKVLEPKNGELSSRSDQRA